MYTDKKQRKSQPKAVQHSVLQQKNKGFQIQDNRPNTTSEETVQRFSTTEVIQKKDMYYWVVSRAGNHYVGTFKNHKTASDWWKANKGSYVGYTFGRGSSRTKYR